MNDDNEVPYEGLEDLVDGFLNERLKEYPILQKSLTNKDYDTIKSYMHKWKGFCEPYGFGPLAGLSRELEAQAMKQDYQECNQLLSKINAYLEKRKNQR